MAASTAAVYAARRATDPTASLDSTTPNMPMTMATDDESDGDSSEFEQMSLARWSILRRKLPPVASVQSLHIFDFDNTLFKTPLPNAKLWSNPTIGFLTRADVFASGGWWHDPRILEATGEGHIKEEPRAWEGWWNEVVVELARLARAQPGTLSVMLTGRAEAKFGGLVRRMVDSKNLEFDMLVLKPTAGPDNEAFASTMAFKQTFLEALMETYIQADEIRIYEDRPHHVRGFRTFLSQYTERRARVHGPSAPAITGKVIPVTDMATNLDPVVEVAEVQHMVCYHNAAVEALELVENAVTPESFGSSEISDDESVHSTQSFTTDMLAAVRDNGHRRLKLDKTVFFTGYLIKEIDTKNILGLLNLPPHLTAREIRRHANSILICPNTCPPSILAKVGGMGHKVRWEVEATGCIENRVWAAKVRPLDAAADSIHTDGPQPLVVLAVSRSARAYEAHHIQHWHPVPRDKMHQFETTVGEKALLRVEHDYGDDHRNEDELLDRRPNASSAAWQHQYQYQQPHRPHRPHNPHNPSRGVKRKYPTGPRPQANVGRGHIPTQPAAYSSPRGSGHHFQPQMYGRGGRGGSGVPRGPSGFSGGRGYRGSLRGRGRGY